MSEQKKDEGRARTLVCAGKRWGGDGLYTLWYDPEETAEKGYEKPEDAGGPERFTFDTKKRVIVGYVGQVFEFAEFVRTEGGKEVRSYRQGKFLRTLDDDAKCAEWEALSRDANVQDEARKKQNASAKHEYLVELLEPLRRAYLKSSPLGRQVLLARVCRVVQGWERE